MTSFEIAQKQILKDRLCALIEQMVDDDQTKGTLQSSTIDDENFNIITEKYSIHITYEKRTDKY